MLNRAEFNQLQSQTLSHMARSMYVFYIQPQVRQGHTLIDPVDLSRKLISSSMAMPCNPTVYDIEIALNELEQHGLIHRLNQALPWQNASIILPLFARELAFVPQPPFTMVASWQPGPGFKDAALLAGLADFSYQEQELRSFINYWMGTTTMRTQSAWERAFIKRLLKMRSAAEMGSMHQRRRSYVKDYKDRGRNANNNNANFNNSNFNGDGFHGGGFNGDGFYGGGFSPAMQPIPERQAPYTTSSLTKRVTLKSIMTGKEDYEITAPGYTADAYKHAGHSGYETYTAAQGYSGQRAPAPSNSNYMGHTNFGNPSEQLPPNNGSYGHLRQNTISYGHPEQNKSPYNQLGQNNVSGENATMQPSLGDQYIPIQSGVNPYGQDAQYSASSMPPATEPMAPQQISDASFYPQQAPREQAQGDLASSFHQPSQFNAAFLQQLKQEFGSNSSHSYDPALDEAYQQYAAAHSSSTTSQEYMATGNAHNKVASSPTGDDIDKADTGNGRSSEQQANANVYVPLSKAMTSSNDDEDVPFYNHEPKPTTRTDKYIPIDRSKLKLD